jgi:hypothetical protein
MSKVCGCKTKEGGTCVRPTRGLKCYQHRGKSTPRKQRSATKRRSLPSRLRHPPSVPTFEDLPLEMIDQIISKHPQAWGRASKTSKWLKTLSGHRRSEILLATCYKPFTRAELLSFINKQKRKKKNQRELHFVDSAHPALDYDYDYEEDVFDLFLPEPLEDEEYSFDFVYDLYVKNLVFISNDSKAELFYELRPRCYKEFVIDVYINPTEEVLSKQGEWTLEDVKRLEQIYSWFKFRQNIHLIPSGGRRLLLTERLRSRYDEMLIRPGNIWKSYEDIYRAFNRD